MFNVKTVSLNTEEQQILLNSIKDECFLFNLYCPNVFQTFGNILGKWYRQANTAIISQMEQHLVQEINEEFSIWKDREEKIENIKSKLLSRVKYLSKYHNTDENKPKLHTSNNISSVSSYLSLFNLIAQANIIRFSCNSLRGFVGDGCLIITKIKSTSVFIPLIVTTTNYDNISYLNLCNYLGETPISKVFNVYVSDILINSKDSEFKNLRIAFKKEYLKRLEECNLEIFDVSKFFVVPELPKFKSIKDRKEFFEELSDDVLLSLTSEVAVNYK